MTKSQQVYGGSLYELAKEEGLTRQIMEELFGVLEIFDANPQYWQLLAEISIPKQERCAAVQEALGGRVQPYLLNFIKILCENGMILQLRGCTEAYRCRYYEDQGIVEVRAVTAVEMKPSMQTALKEKLQTILGKTVELHCKVDRSCIGGVLLELPGRQLDGTVKHRLDKLRTQLRTAVL